MKTKCWEQACERLPAKILAALLTMASSNLLADDHASDLDSLNVANSIELDALRGMNGDTRIRVETNQQLNASVTGRRFTAGTITGGSVTFAENALENFSGIGLFNVVTGNNNAVDSAIGVTFNMQ